MSAPRVTVGLPVFNGERYLATTLDSVLAQDYDDFELLVSDNASTDRTVDIVESRAAADSRVRLVRNERNLGAAYNYNRLVREAHGELFKWAGYDDLLAPSYLRRCVDTLDDHPDAALAFPQTVIIDGDGASVVDYDDRLDLRDSASWRRVAKFARRVSLCNACFGVQRRRVMLTTGLIRPYISSDVPYLAEMAARGTFVQVPERLFYRRVHAGSSRQGHTTMAEVARWFDTSTTRAPFAPRLRLLAGTIGALAGTPAGPVERASLVAAYSAVHGVRRLRIRAGQARAFVSGRDLPKSELIHRVERGAQQ